MGVGEKGSLYNLIRAGEVKMTSRLAALKPSIVDLPTNEALRLVEAVQKSRLRSKPKKGAKARKRTPKKKEEV